MQLHFENGIGTCPCCQGYIGEIHRFCGNCGTQLPPPTDKAIQKYQEATAISEHTSIHEDTSFEKNECGSKFCTFCGQKL
jgi:predicted amidophosphoribosyltransferase